MAEEDSMNKITIRYKDGETEKEFTENDDGFAVKNGCLRISAGGGYKSTEKYIPLDSIRYFTAEKY